LPSPSESHAVWDERPTHWQVALPPPRRGALPIPSSPLPIRPIPLILPILPISLSAVPSTIGPAKVEASFAKADGWPAFLQSKIKILKSKISSFIPPTLSQGVGHPLSKATSLHHRHLRSKNAKSGKLNDKAILSRRVFSSGKRTRTRGRILPLRCLPSTPTFSRACALIHRPRRGRGHQPRVRTASRRAARHPG